MAVFRYVITARLAALLPSICELYIKSANALGLFRLHRDRIWAIREMRFALVFAVGAQNPSSVAFGYKAVRRMKMSYNQLMHVYYAATNRAEEMRALEALHAFTVETSQSYKEMVATPKHQEELKSVKEMRNTFDVLHARKPVTNYVTPLAAKENARKPKDKFVMKGLLTVPKDLRRMSVPSDALAMAQEYKPQASKSLAEQIVSLVSHDKKLMAQAEKAQSVGNVSRVAALVKQIEANRKLAATYVERFNDSGHEIVSSGYTKGFALMPEKEMKTVSRNEPIKAKPLTRTVWDKDAKRYRETSKAFPVKAIAV